MKKIFVAQKREKIKTSQVSNKSNKYYSDNQTTVESEDDINQYWSALDVVTKQIVLLESFKFTLHNSCAFCWLAWFKVITWV